MQLNAQPTCPQCGATLTDKAPRGLCPRCLIELARDLERSEVLPSGEFGNAVDDHPIQIDANRTFGSYELLEEIARGGMGIVYRARQISLGRIVAVKMLLAGPLAGKDFVQRFRTEAAAAASLQHPNIVAIHEVGFAEGQHFFAMDFVEGLTLAQLVAKGLLSARQATTYLKTIAEAIHFAHERNVLHRDLKPSNILIDSATDQPRVTDFGLAKRLEAETDLTLSGQVLGSPNFMSPEQATARRGAVGKHSDVYSLGAILYYSLTGRPPFQGETLTDVLQQVANNDPLAPHLLTPRVPRDLETICLKCLEKEPSGRYQTAQDLADELDRFLRDEPIEARPISPLEKIWRWCRRKPAIASLASATILLLLAVAIGSPIAAFRINRERERAETQRERADQNFYDSDMSLAQHAWDDGDLGRTLSLLEAHRPQPGEKDRRSFEWYYFRNLCEGDERMTLSGHSQAVNCVAFSPDGKLLATGSVGDPVRIWDTTTEKIVKMLPERNVISLAFTPDGKALGIGGRDHVIVWNLETERTVFKQEEGFGEFRIAFSPVGTLLVIGKGDEPLKHNFGSASLWDYISGEKKQVFPDSGGQVALSAHGARLATANWGQRQITTKIWDVASGQFAGSFETGEVVALALSPDGETLATGYGSWGSEVKLWDVTTGLQIGSLINHEHKAWSLAFSPDGKFLATGGADQMVRLWDLATRQQTGQLQGHGGEVMSVAFSPDGQALASGSKDKKAMLWNVHPNRVAPTVSITISSAPVFSPDSRFVAAGIGSNKVAAWDVGTLQEKMVFDGADGPVGFTANGSTLMTQGTNYFLRAFDVATQAPGKTIPGRPVKGPVSHVMLSPNGQILAVGLANGTITFSDAKTGAVMATNAHAYASNVFQLAFSPNGKLLATTGITGGAELNGPTAKVWDTATQKLVEAPLGHTDLVIAVAFSPDGKTLATSSVDDSIRFWDTTTWREIPPSLEQKEYVSALAFSPNGRTLATACADGTLKLWSVATRRELASLKLGIYGSRITFSPDGQTLAAWANFSDGGSLRLWRAPVPDKKQSRPPGG